MSDIQRAVGKFIWKLGVPSKYEGYRYLLSAVCVALENDGELMCLRKSIYEELAARSHTDTRNIERCIRHLIRRWWAEHQCGHLFQKKPTNSELICYLVEYLRLGLGACETCAEKGLLICECDSETSERMPAKA